MTAVLQYRSRRVVSAMRWTGDNLDEVLEFVALVELPESVLGVRGWIGHSPRLRELDIPTPEGRAIAEAGDWILLGRAGDLYPVKAEQFEAAWEAVAS